MMEAYGAVNDNNSSTTSSIETTAYGATKDKFPVAVATSEARTRALLPPPILW